MSTEGVTPLNSVPTATAIAAYERSQPHQTPAPTPLETALAEAKYKEGETLEQLALTGDALAIAQLVHEHHERISPSTAAAQHPPHPPGAAEPGKGQQIDEYD